MKIRMFTDGACRGNPGPSSAAVYFPDLGQHWGADLGVRTNNQAEYMALIHGLAKAIELGATEVEVFSDSELMVKHMTGEYQCKNQNLIPFYEQATELTYQLDDFTITHVMREDNKQADAIGNAVLDASRESGALREDLYCLHAPIKEKK